MYDCNGIVMFCMSLLQYEVINNPVTEQMEGRLTWNHLIVLQVDEVQEVIAKHFHAVKGCGAKKLIYIT